MFMGVVVVVRVAMESNRGQVHAGVYAGQNFVLTELLVVWYSCGEGDMIERVRVGLARSSTRVDGISRKEIIVGMDECVCAETNQ